MKSKSAPKASVRSKAIISNVNQNSVQILEQIHVDLGNGFTVESAAKTDENIKFAFDLTKNNMQV
jgi:hypothetical protein